MNTRILSEGFPRSVLAAVGLLLTLAASASLAALPEQLKTDKGMIAGTALDGSGGEVKTYRGIPYAAAPVGEFRWRPPQPVKAWEGVRQARDYQKMCPQPFPASPVADSVPESGMSEDCLYLNVTTAAESADEKRPVMVWFHGGGLTTGWGNSDSYNSAPLPQKGAVVVSVTHRLGPIGYMAHPALTAESERNASGNYGSLDTIAALEWVQSNISEFGGDPDNVTIFGVSGGGQKTFFLLASPLAEGLFDRAIVMSGGVGATPLEESEQLGTKLADAVGVEGNDQAALKELRAKPWQELIKAAGNRDSGYRSIFTIDDWSLEGVAAQNDVPLMIGFMGAEKAPERSPAFIARAITPATDSLSTQYAYVFTHIPYGWGSKGGLAYHGGDVSYAFGVPESINSHFGTLFRPDKEMNIPRDPGLDERDDWVAEAMTDMVVQFAKTGDPNLSEAQFEKLGKSWHWPELDAEDQYLDIGVTPIVKRGWVEVGEDQQKPRY